MANEGSIDEIIGQEAIKGVDITTQKMEDLYKVFVQNVAIINIMKDTLSDQKSIEQVTTNVTELESATKKITSTTKEYTLTKAAAAVEQSRLRSELKNTATQLNENVGAYGRLNAKHKELEKQAKDAGVQLGLESEQFKKLSAEATKYRDSLAKVEQAVGNNSRITGDYRQKLFGVTQVLRELPAFTYSAQTGILGISNNLPILADNFKSVASAVNETTGKVNGTVGALKIFGASIFSFGNIFAIALGLFTIFSKQIFEFIGGLTGATTAVKRFQDVLISDTVVNARKEMVSLYESLDLVRKGLISKEAFLKEYNATLGETVGQTKDFNVAEQNTIKSAQAYIEMTIMKADAESLLATAIEKARKAKDLQKDEGFFTTLKAQLAKTGRDFSKNPNPSMLFSGLMKPEESLEEYRQAFNDEAKAAEKAYVEARERLAKFMQKNTFSSTVNDDKPKPTTTKSKNKEEDIIKPWITSYKMLRINFEQFKGELTDETRKAVEKNLDDLIKVAKDKMAQNPISFTWTWADSLEAFAEQATIFLTKTQEIVSEAGEAINTISQVSTDKELVRLDQKEKALKNYYDNELRFIEESGMSSDRKEREKRKLEAETEAKRKQIDRDRITALRKQASIEKATAIANIIVTNALAIAKQLVATPLPAGAVFVASQVALGAAQLYAAINAPLPQYAKGRKGGKAEFAETNEQGAELHITKDGKAYIPNEGKRGVTFLDEGTSVLPADITKQIMSASYITLAQATQGKTEALQLALLEKTDKEIIELIGLRKDLRAKEMSTTFNNNTSFEAWKNMWKK